MSGAVKAMAAGLVCLMFLAGGVAVQGASTEVDPSFQSLHCGGCHKAEGKGIGLSLKEISAGYAGKAEQLTAYLSGGGQAMLNPAKARVMAPQIKKTQNLGPAELKALVQYLLSF